MNSHDVVAVVAVVAESSPCTIRKSFNTTTIVYQESLNIAHVV